MSSDNHQCIEPDELLAKIKTNIQEYGLQIIGISATDYFPSFSYSIGLYESYQHPEIICFGLPIELAHIIINDVADLIRNGETIKPYTPYENIFKDSKAEFLLVDSKNIKDYFNAALSYYQHNHFSALQLVWTDHNNKLPWEDNFEEKFIY